MLPNKYIQAYLPFERNANDFSGKGNNASTSGVVLSTGKFGKAYSFDGINDYISSPINSGFKDKFSLSCWVYFDVVNATEILFSKYGDSSFTPALNKRQWYLYLSNTGGISFRWFGGLTTSPFLYKIINFDITLSAETWYHLVLTYDNTLGVDERSKLYVNTQEIDIDSIATGGTPLNIQDANNYIGMGNFIGDGTSTIPTSNLLDGKMDNVILIDDYALTPSNVKRLYYNLHLI